MKISTKLYLLTALLLALAGAIGVTGLYGMNVTVNSLKTVYEDRVVPLRDIKEISDAYAVHVVDATHKVRDGVLTPAQGLTGVEQAERLIDARWNAYLATVLVPEEQRLVAEITPRMEVANAAITRLKTLLTHYDPYDLGRFAATELYRDIDPVSESISRLVEVQLDVARREFELGEASYAGMRNTSIGLILLGLIAGFGIATWTIRTAVQGPLAQTQTVAGEIARGNLGIAIPTDRKDEMGRLLKSLAGMRDGLRTMVVELKTNAEGVASEAAQLASTSTQLAGATEHQAESASAMAAAVEQMTVSINHVSDSAREAHSISMDTNERSNAGNTMIRDTLVEMDKISHTVNDAAETIRAMGESSQKVSSIVQMIREVAEQTNLLALNAAIEAARAGEQGRGFAVVADEVRKLAERTAQATTDIYTMIGEVQTNAKSAVAIMERAVERVDGGAKLARQTGETMNTIGDSARQVVNVVNEISSALKEQSTASNDIATNVERIAQMSEENHSATRMAADSAHRLEELAASTRQAVSIFKL